MAKGGSKKAVDVGAKSYVVERDGKFVAVIHITYDDTLLEVEWDVHFDTADECRVFLLSDTQRIVKEVCDVIGLEVDQSTVTDKNKAMH